MPRFSLSRPLLSPLLSTIFADLVLATSLCLSSRKLFFSISWRTRNDAIKRVDPPMGRSAPLICARATGRGVCRHL